MRLRIFLPLLAASLTFFLSTFALAQTVKFTGHVDKDFPKGSCITDPGLFGNPQDVLFAVGLTDLHDSGFDFTKICILYDAAIDQLQVGLYNSIDTNLIAGDTDGNGDPGTVSSDLSSSPITDVPNFGIGKFFTLILDFDFNATNGFSMVAGKPAEKTMADYDVVTPTSIKLSDADSKAMYGDPPTSLATFSDAVTIPSQNWPHLEFSIAHFSQVSAAPILNPKDPNFDPLTTAGLFFEMGNQSDFDYGIFYDIFPDATLGVTYNNGFYPLTVAHLLQIDTDGDGIIDDVDSDADGDGVPNLIELGLNSCDLNGDGILDEGEILKCHANGFDAHGTGAVLLKDFAAGGKYPDFDGDGIPNYLDSDSDKDGLTDGQEDKNANGIVDKGETDPYNADSDGGGAKDGIEVQCGTDPLDPSDDGRAVPGCTVPQPPSPPTPAPTPTQIVIQAPTPTTTTSPGTDAGTLDPHLAGYTTDQVQVSGAGLSSCSLVPTGDASSPLYIMIAIMLLVPLSLRERARVRGRETIILLALGISLFATPAHALDVQLEHLPTNGYGGLFQDNTQMLGQYHWNTAIGFDYTKKPLQVSVISSGNGVDTLVNYFLTQDTVVAFGLADWLDISVAVQSNIPSKVEPFGAAVATTQTDFGDLMVSAKFLLMDPVEQKYGIGLALIPFATLPTGNSNRYIGNSSMTGGFKVIGERYFGCTDAYMTLGARFRETEDMLNLSVGNEFLFAFGAQHPISTRHDLHIMGEFDGSTVFKKFMHQENSSPVEMNGGLRKYWLNRRLATTVSIGAGLDNGYGSPRFRAMGALSFLSHPVTDRDDDRVVDPGDYCPTQIVDADHPGKFPGCPEQNTRVIVRVVGDRILILQPINFETGSAKITQDSTEVVDQVALLLNKTPELQKVLVEGHTDNIGGAAYNQKLSKERAKAVVDALVAQGVAPDRLTSQGWGLSRPLTTNATEAGRAKNRRVEFHILEFKAK